MKNKKNGIKFKIKFLFIYNHLLAEFNILKKFGKIQSFYFPTVHNIYIQIIRNLETKKFSRV